MLNAGVFRVMQYREILLAFSAKSFFKILQQLQNIKHRAGLVSNIYLSQGRTLLISTETFLIKANNRFLLSSVF